jgi:DNA-binding transcriptional ArsR family regulator
MPNAAVLDRTLAALADPTRRRVVERLAKGPRRAGELAGDLSVSAPSMSRQLGVLREAGLIEDTGVEGDARVRLYRLRPAVLAGLRRWLERLDERAARPARAGA